MIDGVGGSGRGEAEPRKSFPFAGYTAVALIRVKTERHRVRKHGMSLVLNT